jgi:serine/threonine protein kinase
LDCSSSYKLIDFGLICDIEDNRCIHQLVGTPLYIAPYITMHHRLEDRSYKSDILNSLKKSTEPINIHRIIVYLKRNDWYALGLTITELFELNKFTTTMTPEIKNGILYLCDIINDYSGYTTENILKQFNLPPLLRRSSASRSRQASARSQSMSTTQQVVYSIELLMQRKKKIEQDIEKEQIKETKKNNLKRILMNINMDIAEAEAEAKAKLTHLKKK